MTTKKEFLLKDEFIKHISATADFLNTLKVEFDGYDLQLTDDEKIKVLNKRKKKIFEKLDFYFDQIWEDFKDLTEEGAVQYKDYFVKNMMSYLAEDIETNSYIRRRPLGYAGDYVTMNFIYDYQEGRFLGKTLYAKLINHYTCNIDVACSNIFRKKYLKKKILQHLSDKEEVQILSVGCGPAREIIELLREEKITVAVVIHLLDLEKNAIEYVVKELKSIDYDREKIKIRFYMFDLIDLVKSKKIAALFQRVNFVYISGVFDYLSDRLATKVTKEMFKIVKRELIIFNMSFENARHRAYYEIFGEWIMYHRKKDEILNWTNSLEGYKKISIQSYPDCRSYWILEVER